MSDYGMLTITRHTFPGDGASLGGYRPETFTADWEGAPTILISRENLDGMAPPLRRDGDVLSICQYRLRLRSGLTSDGDYIADRIGA